MRKHVMFDLETLGKTPNCVVLSVGAVIFSAEEIIGKKHWFLSLDEQLKTRKIDASTLSWWMTQGEEAKNVFKHSEMGVPVRHFLTWFTDFYKSQNSVLLVWGNGASFDVPILEHLLYSNSMTIPWKYWDIRCYRTVKKAHSIENGRVRQGIKHDALSDALFQAECLQAFLGVSPEYDA